MGKGNLRKVLFSALAAVLAALLFLAGMYLLVMSGNSTGSEKMRTEAASEQREVPSGQSGGQPPEQFLQAFAEILYTYDTRERMYYEGAEAFMTPQAYAELLPFSEGEPLESSGKVPAVVSSLQETKCYFSCPSETGAEVIMESCFTLSGSGNGQILQYIKLGIEKQGSGWKITGINVLDTLEQ